MVKTSTPAKKTKRLSDASDISKGSESSTEPDKSTKNKENSKVPKKQKVVGVFSGKVILLQLGQNEKDFSAKLTENGAKMRKSLTKDVTHIIFENGSKSIFEKAAKSENKIPIVNPAWIDACLKQDKIVDTRDFIVHTESKLSTTSSKTTLPVPEEKKVATSQKTEENIKDTKPPDTKPPAKKLKTSNFKSPVMANSPTDKDAETKKDVTEKATSGKLNKPVKEKDASNKEKTLKRKAASKVEEPKKKMKKGHKKKQDLQDTADEADDDTEMDSDQENFNEESDQAETDLESEDAPIEAIEIPKAAKIVKKQKKPGEIKRYIAVSGVTNAIRDIIQQATTFLPGSYFQEEIQKSTTHLIIGPSNKDEQHAKPQRTAKYIIALSRGIKIMKPNWAISSLTKEEWISETENDEDGESYSWNLPAIAESIKGKGKLFDKADDGTILSIYIAQTNIERKSIQQIIENSGAKAVNNIQAATIILGDSLPLNSGSRRKSLSLTNEEIKAPLVSEEWLLDCLSQFKLLPVENYLIDTPAPLQEFSNEERVEPVSSAKQPKTKVKAPAKKLKGKKSPKSTIADKMDIDEETEKVNLDIGSDTENQEELVAPDSPQY